MRQDDAETLQSKWCFKTFLQMLFPRDAGYEMLAALKNVRSASADMQSCISRLYPSDVINKNAIEGMTEGMLSGKMGDGSMIEFFKSMAAQTRKGDMAANVEQARAKSIPQENITDKTKGIFYFALKTGKCI